MAEKKTRYIEAPIRALWYIFNQDLPVLLMQFVCSIHKTSEIIDARHSFKKWISTLEQFHQGSRPNLYHHQQIFETITKINAFLIINLFGQVQRATNFWAKDKKGLVNLWNNKNIYIIPEEEKWNKNYWWNRPKV